MKRYLLYPDEARAWGDLTKADPTNNRPLRLGRVSRFANIIKGGRWKLTPDMIVRDPKTGAIKNGQHRVAGCAAAGVPIFINLAEPQDIDLDSMADWDAGSLRTGADNLWLEGHTKNTGTLASTAAMVWLFDYRGTFDGMRPSNTDLVNFVSSQDRQYLEDAVEYAQKNARKLAIPPNIFGSLYFLFHEANFDKAQEFFAKLIEDFATLPEGSPILTLRKKLLGVGPTQRIKKPDKIKYIIRAWNSFFDGKELKVFQPSNCGYVINGRPSLAVSTSSAVANADEPTYTPNSGESIREIVKRFPNGGSFLVLHTRKAGVYPTLSTLGYSVKTEEIDHSWVRVYFTPCSPVR